MYTLFIAPLSSSELQANAWLRFDEVRPKGPSAVPWSDVAGCHADDEFEGLVSTHHIRACVTPGRLCESE